MAPASAGRPPARRHVRGECLRRPVQVVFFACSPAAPLRLAVLWEVTGSLLVSTCFFLFAVRFAGSDRLAGRRVSLLVLSCACVAAAVLVADPSLVYLSGHGLGSLSFTLDSVGTADGPLFWVQEAVFYVVVAAGMLLLAFDAPAHVHLRRGQRNALLAGGL